MALHLSPLKKRRRGSTRRTGLVIVLLVIIIAASVTLYSSYFDRSANSTSTSAISSVVTSSVRSSLSTTNPTSSTTSPTNSSGSFVVVLIPYGIYSNQKLNFEPADLKVVIGVNSTVRWVNKDYTLHTISTLTSPTNSSAFYSTPVFQGGSFEYTFTVPGTYEYYCPWHPGWMKGTVTVLQRG